MCCDDKDDESDCVSYERYRGICLNMLFRVEISLLVNRLVVSFVLTLFAASLLEVAR